MERTQLQNIFADKNQDSVAVIEAAAAFMANVKAGRDPDVKPGSTERFTEGCVPGDGIRQGDIYITLQAALPKKGYKEVTEKTIEALQLVPGNTKGAKHVLDSWDGVKLYRPTDWSGDQFKGPYILTTENREIRHEEHGTVCLLPGTYSIHYQREKDAMDAAERRRLD
jgi:hypothetical protein